MTLSHYYQLAAGVTAEFEGKLLACSATTLDLQATDFALQQLEKEADQLSLAAANSQDRMDAEQLWLHIRQRRETLGLPPKLSIHDVLDGSTIQ